MTPSVPEWVKDAVFYQIFPDRFARSDHISRKGLMLETWESPPTYYGFKGGDLLGVAEHLDYLQDLGITALYFNPIFSSASNHRYHTYDYYAVDPLLGGNEAFKKMLDAAHRRGMRVILDGVFNHASRGFWQFHHVLENGDGSPYVDWFYFNSDRLHRQKHWGAYPTQAEQRALREGASSFDTLGYRAWWNLPALPKLNTDTFAVREFIWDVAEYWVKFGIDGWRLDVPSEIDDDAFWQEFRRRVKGANPDAYIVGEIWHEAQRWLQGDQFDAVMNYILTGALIGFLYGNRLDEDIKHVGDYSRYLRPLDSVSFADRIDYLLSLYPSEINQAQFNLLDSHDTPRFLTTVHGDRSILKMAWLFLFSFMGAPCIYYGDEIGMEGGRDPDCRRSFTWDQTKWDQDLRGYLKELIALRQSQPALRHGAFKRLFAENDVYAFARQLGDDRLVFMMNVSDQGITLPDINRSLEFAAAVPEVVFGDRKAIVSRDGRYELRLEPHSGVVFMA